MKAAKESDRGLPSHHEPDVVVECLTCGHSGVLTRETLSRFSIGPNTPIAAFVKRLRCRRCGSPCDPQAASSQSLLDTWLVIHRLGFKPGPSDVTLYRKLTAGKMTNDVLARIYIGAIIVIGTSLMRLNRTPTRSRVVRLLALKRDVLGALILTETQVNGMPHFAGACLWCAPRLTGQ
jgi:hypothetical protein